MIIDDGPSGCPTEEFLISMVRENTGERSWDDDPRASVSLINGLLCITQTARVHREIRELLPRLRF